MACLIEVGWDSGRAFGRSQRSVSFVASRSDSLRREALGDERRGAESARIAMMEPAAIHQRLAAQFGEKVTGFEAGALQPWAVVAPEAIADVAAWLKTEPDLAFDNLMCQSVVDYPKETPPRMEMVYHVFSYPHRHLFVLKVMLPREQPTLPTVEGVWPVANWHEREAYDMFGVHFLGHSDPRRILLPDDWTGHPLRKDWVDPDFYNGLHVKPTPQMADRAMGGEKIGIGPFDFTPPNRHVEE